MKRFFQGEHRGQGTLLPKSLDDYVSNNNPVRIVDVFVGELDLVNLSSDGLKIRLITHFPRPNEQGFARYGLLIVYGGVLNTRRFSR